MKYFFCLILCAHGLIHLMGVSKAFYPDSIPQLTKSISKPVGIVWLVAAALLTAAALMLLLKIENWYIVGIIAGVVSQVLIVSSWKDAKFGTIANAIILFVAIFTLTSQGFESKFRRDVDAHLSRSNQITPDLITEADLQPLPHHVQNYLRYADVLHKPRVKNMKLVFDGQMRGKGKDWFKFSSIQYNFFDEPARLFFMKATLFGIVVPGYHNYENAQASMDIRLFGLFPLVQAKGLEISKAETVTVFNDMCIMAPAALIDKRIAWEEIDHLSAKATFTNGSNKISATLYFNDTGQLVNFISDDRYDINDMRRYRFSTPMRDYKLFTEINAPAYGEAIWHYPDEAFVYGKFLLKSIAYNVSTL